MSAFAYGKAVGNRAQLNQEALARADADSGGDNKLVTAIAGLIPAEVIAAHAFVLGFATTKDEAGNLILKPGNDSWLAIALVGLTASAFLLFLAGHGRKPWEPLDWIRMLIPPAAFVIWTALIGTSVLTPFIAGVPALGVAVVAVIAGLILAAISAFVTPPTDGGPKS